MKLSKLQRHGWFLFFLGLAVIVAITVSIEVISRPNWQPLTMPLQLRVKTITSPQFKVEDTSEYLISLDFDRSMDFQKLNCLIGMETLYPERCKGINDALNVSWTLFKNQRIEAKGNASDYKARGYWGTSIGRNIGSFNGDKSATYSLELKIRENAEELDIANPKIEVQVHPRAIEARGYYFAIPIYLSVVIGLPVGLFIGGIKLIRFWELRRSQQKK